MTYVITLAQQKGGSGKSTLAAHIAIALKKLGYTIKLIDIDPQKTLNTWFNIREKKHANTLLPIEFATCTGWKVSNEISNSKTQITIIDSPPHIEAETKAAIRSANLVIIPLQATPNDIWASEAIIDFVLKENKDIIVAVNRATHTNKLVKNLDNFIPNYIAKFLIGNRAIFANSMFNGSTALEVDAKSQAANEILEFAAAIEVKLKFE